MFERWQRPALTTILHRQKLGYMRTHLDDILAPRQAALILVTMCNWPRVHHTAGLIQDISGYHTPLLLSVALVGLYYYLNRRRKFHMGIEPIPLGWKPSILTAIRMEQNNKKGFW